MDRAIGRGAAKKKITKSHVLIPDRPKKSTHPPFFSLLFFSKKFLLRFWVFLGMGGSKTAKKLFWKFFGHDPKSHLMTQKIFFRYLFCTFPAILRPPADCEPGKRRLASARGETGRRYACGALRERQRGGGEGQKGVASVGATLLQKPGELNRSACGRSTPPRYVALTTFTI